MARRNKSSVFEDVIQLVAILPWWLGILLALISYFWLHSIASQPITSPPPDIKHMGDMVVSQMWHTFAIFLQYIIPISCLIGAGISAFQRSKKNNSILKSPISPARKSYVPKNDSAAINVAQARQIQTTPDCPQCGASMVKRTAKKGSNAGEVFWGCTGYPKCKGTRAFEE